MWTLTTNTSLKFYKKRSSSKQSSSTATSVWGLKLSSVFERYCSHLTPRTWKHKSSSQLIKNTIQADMETSSQIDLIKLCDFETEWIPHSKGCPSGVVWLVAGCVLPQVETRLRLVMLVVAGSSRFSRTACERIRQHFWALGEASIRWTCLYFQEMNICKGNVSNLEEFKYKWCMLHIYLSIYLHTYLSNMHTHTHTHTHTDSHTQTHTPT
jgi:hypothetical protein